MRVLLPALLLLFASAASAGDVRTDQQVYSPALNKPLTYSIYLPGAYGRGGERFPVIYLLHGYGANHKEWLARGNLEQILDSLIASGEIPPLIAVMPYAAKSWYVDSAKLGGPGDYETALARDLISHIDSRYRSVNARSHRMVAGLSMGGYGALRLAFFHPGTFSAVASFSGALFEDAGIPDFAGGAGASEAAEKWYLGAFGRPFDRERYMALNPFSRVGAIAKRPDPPRILITSGDDDYFDFYEGSAALFIDLRRAGVPAELRIDDGGHDWKLWRKQFTAGIGYLTEPLGASTQTNKR